MGFRKRFSIVGQSLLDIRFDAWLTAVRFDNQILIGGGAEEIGGPQTKEVSETRPDSGDLRLIKRSRSDGCSSGSYTFYFFLILVLFLLIKINSVKSLSVPQDLFAKFVLGKGIVFEAVIIRGGFSSPIDFSLLQIGFDPGLPAIGVNFRLLYATIATIKQWKILWRPGRKSVALDPVFP